jgi:probable addiction module antidote protein
LETEDVAYIAAALGTIAHARGMIRVAKETGVTREALYKALAAVTILASIRCSLGD